MRRTICTLILFAGITSAQWRRFGEEPQGRSQSDFSREMLVAHNAVRASVGVPPLEWSGQLAARAQDWADSLLARRRLSHRADSPYGENLFGISGAAASPSMVVDNWARESRDYDYRKNRCNGVCGHFTQIVWVETNRVGCAVARGGGREVWVCNYDPAGNRNARRPY